MENNSPMYKRLIIGLMSGLLFLQNIASADSSATEQGTSSQLSMDGSTASDTIKEVTPEWQQGKPSDNNTPQFQ
jgi:hypothetical protein